MKIRCELLGEEITLIVEKGNVIYPVKIYDETNDWFNLYTSMDTLQKAIESGYLTSPYNGVEHIFDKDYSYRVLEVMI